MRIKFYGEKNMVNDYNYLKQRLPDFTDRFEGFTEVNCSCLLLSLTRWLEMIGLIQRII